MSKTDWLAEATIALDDAMTVWEDQKVFAISVSGPLNADKIVRSACLVAYQHGLANARRQDKEKDLFVSNVS